MLTSDYEPICRRKNLLRYQCLNSVVRIRLQCWFNTLRPGDVYIETQWTRSALVQVMVPRLCGTKLLPEPTLTYYQLDPHKQTSAKFLWKYNFFHNIKMHLKMSSELCRPFCCGLHLISNRFTRTKTGVRQGVSGNDISNYCYRGRQTWDRFTKDLWANNCNHAKILFAIISDSYDPIRSQSCTCHDSSAVVTCAKLWLD